MLTRIGFKTNKNLTRPIHSKPKVSQDPEIEDLKHSTKETKIVPSIVSNHPTRSYYHKYKNGKIEGKKKHPKSKQKSSKESSTKSYQRWRFTVSASTQG